MGEAISRASCIVSNITWVRDEIMNIISSVVVSSNGEAMEPIVPFPDEHFSLEDVHRLVYVARNRWAALEEHARNHTSPDAEDPWSVITKVAAEAFSRDIYTRRYPPASSSSGGIASPDSR